MIAPVLAAMVALSIPPSAPKIVDLVAVGHGSCALRDDGRAVCWGRHPSFPALLGITSDGRRGPETLEHPTVVPALASVRAIALGGDGWAVTHDGALVSWSADAREEAVAKRKKLERKGVTDVVASRSIVCLRDDAGAVICADDETEGDPWALRDADGGPLPQGDLQALPWGQHGFEIVGEKTTVRIDLDRVWASRGDVEKRVPIEPRTWRGPTWEDAYARRKLGVPITGARRTGDCLLADGRVWCWRDPDAWGPTPQVVGTATIFALHDGWLCLARGASVRCLARAGGEASFDLGIEVTAIDVGEKKAVVAGKDGRIGTIALKPATTGPLVIDPALRVSDTPVVASERRSADPCVLVRDGSLHCFEDAGLRTAKVGGTPIALDASVGIVRLSDGRIVALRADGSPRDLHPKSDAAFAMGRGKVVIFDGPDVFVHNGRTSVDAWNVPADLAAHAPARDRPSLAVSDTQTCVIEGSGDVHCACPSESGSRRRGGMPLLAAPCRTHVALGGPAKAIVASKESTCAHLAGGEVACWGKRYGGPLGLAAAGEMTAAITGAR